MDEDGEDSDGSDSDSSPSEVEEDEVDTPQNGEQARFVETFLSLIFATVHTSNTQRKKALQHSKYYHFQYRYQLFTLQKSKKTRIVRTKTADRCVKYMRCA